MTTKKKIKQHEEDLGYLDKFLSPVGLQARELILAHKIDAEIALIGSPKWDRKVIRIIKATKDQIYAEKQIERLEA